MRAGFAATLMLAVVVGLSGCATSGGLPPEDRIRAADANTQLGIAYLRRGDLQQALRKLQKAIEQDENSSSAHMAIAVVYERLDEPDLAQTHYRRALSLDPENSPAANNYARFLCGRGRLERALELFDRAAANPLYENPAIPVSNAGICLHDAGEYDRAEDYLLRALKMEPTFAPALLHMADIRYREEQYLSARAYYQRYLEVAEQNAESAWLGVRIEHQLGDKDALASYALLLKGKFPDAPQTRKLLEWEQDGRI